MQPDDASSRAPHADVPGTGDSTHRTPIEPPQESEGPPPFVPDYDKPDDEGLHMTFDNTISVYHVVGPQDDFEAAAQGVFAYLKEAQDQFPDWPRVLYLDIEGHREAEGRFTEDFVELQQEFLIGALGPFFTALALPLVQVVNPEQQRNDVPDSLALGPPE
jgi:hypothetical protein